MKIILLFFLLCRVAYSEDSEWIINRDHSQINFKVNYLKFGSVLGRFSQFYGQVRMVIGPQNDLLPAAISMTIQAASLDTANKMRDGHLLAAEFFDVKNHPTIHFESTNVEKETGSDHFLAKGELTIKGLKRPVVFMVELSSPINDTWNYKSIFANYSGTIKRKDFGIVWDKTLIRDGHLVGEEVMISGEFQLQPQGAQTVGSKHLIPDNQAIRQREKIHRREIRAPLETVTTISSPSVEIAVASDNKTSAIIADERHDLVRERSLTWWLAFSFLGFLGFAGCAILAIKGKLLLLQHVSEKYAELNWMGHMSDVIAIGFIFLYSLCFWLVGWGP